MKKYILGLFLVLVSYSLYSQKVTVKVLKKENPAVSEWQVLDENYIIVFSGNEYYRSDSVIFSLDANKRYFLHLSVTSVAEKDSAFFTLLLEDEPLMYIKTDIGTGDHFFPFFTGTRTQNVKITGGTTALINEFPYQVYYISGNYVCGGSIIGNRWILTAAHCTEDDYGNSIPASQMAIRAGMNDPGNPTDGQIYYVKNVIVHEGYDNYTLLNDIAILELKDTINTPNASPIKIITTVDVANGATDPGVMSWVTGWGLTGVNPDVLPTSLQKVQLPLITNAQAATVWGSSITATDLMAGYLDGNKDACSGDSGGPLVVPVYGEYKLAGVVSWGSPECNTYGAYTRVSLFDDWIRANTDIPVQFWPPVPAGDTLVCQGTEATSYSIDPVVGATMYDWSLSPAVAGTISNTNGDAIVTWNSSYAGTVDVAVRVTVNSTLSEWSVLKPKVVKNTVL
ncbi:MAG TPA: trypsin-like serine protease, partial [Bacteroidales bacterium]|nr:trypsin-like serine protease [Bacteroidales bacterium]